MTHPFFALHRQGFVRVAACTPRIAIADPARNAQETLDLMRRAASRHADLVVFPELGLSAYAIDDLFLQDALLAAVETGLASLVAASRDLAPVFVVGAPLRRHQRLHNCAVVISRGRIAGVVPKSFLPNYREYYEARWFAPGAGLTGLEIDVAGQRAPFGTDLVFASAALPDFVFHVEICEDLWAATPPSTQGALSGATILCNLSASNAVIGKAAERELLCASQSLRCQAAYVYAAAGPGESTTDLAWDGQATIHELGTALARTARFPTTSQMTVADVDVERIRAERLRTPTFDAAARAAGQPERAFRRVTVEHAASDADVGLERPIDRFPFVPDDPERLDRDCFEAFNIQVQGLRQRLQATGLQHVVIGVSGGLDSGHALLVAARTFDSLGLPRANILGFTMPGFATSEATKANAWALMHALGVTAAELDIRPAARQMLADLGHPFARGEARYDVTFENVQAGLRTDYLFRLANQRRGLVLGTGDLSELALGWCTYGVGDHMSHYNVNGSLAKTLIQHLMRWVATSGEVDAAAHDVILAIVATEISPELVPAGAGGEIQSTQQVVGPYELQDFHLFYLTRYGLRPSKVAFLAWHAWRDAAREPWPPAFPAAARRAYDLATIRRWLAVFLRRFFAESQFKRSALPNGPKVVTGGSLSPRGDWRAPADGNANAWLAELDANVPAEG
ncbi:MAG: NAD(+) synthase [Burkholderiales bacterium]|nr:NAD(+) synthase [Burkholderiales bacterium]